MDFEFTHPILLAAGLVLALIAALLMLRQRELVGWWAAAMVIVGALAAALAAGGLRVTVPAGQPIKVLVDMSDSTRTAEYRDEQALTRRIDQLLGGPPYSLERFDARPVFDRPTLLFSDGRFEAEALSGPVFPVVDPALSATRDARIADVMAGGNEAVAIVENSGTERVLRAGERRVTIPAGRSRVPVGPADREPMLSLSPGDAWPENDSMRMLPPPSESVARLACRIDASGVNPIAPADLPQHAGALASCSILLLDAGAASELTDLQQQAIASWVRNLGGSLVLVGQDDRWIHLRRSLLGEISPLSPDPPVSAREWVILIDVSGSMAQNERGQEKWLAAMAAGQELLEALPRNDLSRVGLFSTAIRWTAAGKVSEVTVQPPENFLPRGPTNLDRALQAVLALPAGQRELILLTDAEVELPESARVVGALREQNVRVSCLMLSEGRGRGSLQQLAEGTGGVAAMELDPRMWAGRAGELAGKLAPARWRDEPLQVVTSEPLRKGELAVAGYNEAFVREGSVVFGRADSRPMAARWQVGLGSVATLTFSLPADRAGELATALERQPADDRYAVEWSGGNVQVEADGKVDLRVHVAGPAGEAEWPMTARAPGRYEAALPDMSAGGHAVVLDGGRVVGRRTFSPSYPREFAVIGNDLERLQRLATSTGGRIIEPEERMPIDELRSRRFISLGSALGVVGIGLMAAAILVLRRRI